MPSLFSPEFDEDTVLDDEDTACQEGKVSRDNADGAVEGELACLKIDMVPADKELGAYVPDDCERALACSTVEELGVSVEPSQATPMPLAERHVGVQL